jgi:VanZ family protein
MIQKFVAICAWALLVFIASATISPFEARPTLSTSPRVEHLAAFAVLGLLFLLAYPRHTILVCVVVLGSALLLELAQLIIPGRHARVVDAIEKMAGGALGVVSGQAILCFDQASRWFQS